MTFANDFNRTHEQVPVGSQALALLVTGDRAIFRNVRLLGNQDTLYAGSKRQYFVDCYIEGNVDFIFGDAKAVFEGCEIHSTPHSGGYITAQGRATADAGQRVRVPPLQTDRRARRDQRVAGPSVAPVCQRGVSEYRDGRAHRAGGMARVAPRRDSLHGDGELCRVPEYAVPERIQPTARRTRRS